jgi:UrcA family protein
MKSFVNRFALIGTTAMALGLGIGHAYAATPDDTTPTHVVGYRDLDLSQPRDAQRLYRRIQTAARLVCDKPLPPSLEARALFATCVEKAVTRAVEQVGSTRVTQIHEAATQREGNRS